MTRKVIIAGSRDWVDKKRMEECLWKVCPPIRFLEGEPITEFVSGNAPGADRLGEEIVKEWGYTPTLFPADWDRYGRKAGIIRNLAMANYADCLVAFWDGTSPGTRHMIGAALECGMELHVFRIK